MKMCSLRFVHWRFIQEIFPLWRCVHGDLSFEDWSVGDLSLLKICHLKIWIRDLSLENLSMEICPVKIWIGDLSLEDLSFEDLFRRFFIFHFVLEIYPLKKIRKSILWNFLGDFLKAWKCVENTRAI